MPDTIRKYAGADSIIVHWNGPGLDNIFYSGKAGAHHFALLAELVSGKLYFYNTDNARAQSPDTIDHNASYSMFHSEDVNGDGLYDLVLLDQAGNRAVFVYDTVQKNLVHDHKYCRTQ